MAATIDRLSTAIWPAAAGLLIGLIAFAGLACLEQNAEAFEREMDGAALDLLNCLSRI